MTFQNLEVLESMHESINAYHSQHIKTSPAEKIPQISDIRERWYVRWKTLHYKERTRQSEGQQIYVMLTLNKKLKNSKKNS